jgi:hypothetical protein
MPLVIIINMRLLTPTSDFSANLVHTYRWSRSKLATQGGSRLGFLQPLAYIRPANEVEAEVLSSYTGRFSDYAGFWHALLRACGASREKKYNSQDITDLARYYTAARRQGGIAPQWFLTNQVGKKNRSYIMPPGDFD